MKFFKRHIIPKKSFLKRFFNLPAKEHFLPNLCNLLASLDLEEVRMEDVEELYHIHAIDPLKDLKVEREELYFDYLLFSVEQNQCIARAAREKHILLNILKLELWQVIKIHKRVANYFEANNGIATNLIKSMTTDPN